MFTIALYLLNLAAAPFANPIADDAYAKEIRAWQATREKKLIAEKRAEYMEKVTAAGGETNSEGFPAGAQLCNKCSTKAAIIMDGCLTCLNCGESKCG